MMTSVILENGGGGRLFDKFKNCSETHLHISLFQDSQILKNANVLCVSPERDKEYNVTKIFLIIKTLPSPLNRLSILWEMLLFNI